MTVARCSQSAVTVQCVMMTSSQIRQSFLDFFKSKSHTIVRSSPLDYRSRDGSRIFTNAGMNQFVPIFLGEQKPDVDRWGDTIAKGLPTRAADTQKCIRATGKHNDLEDVGLDTYHHTFFEMLGNWSFGDYFKKEAIEWAWELVVKAWGFPADRLYATVCCPYLGEPGWEAKWRTELEQVLVLAMTSQDFISPDPNASPFDVADQEGAMYWAKKFETAGLDPRIHIIPGNKKDNFWMMGETGPCGPCSELHMDLTPAGDTKGSLVNKADARCIEIWNLVFMQFNASPDGTYSALPARHVDTGMGFERVTSIIQGTKGLKDFANAKISNYETDIFRPIFDALEKLSGKKYCSTLPSGCSEPARPPALDPDNLKDLAIVATARIARGINFEAWAAETVQEFGDVVKPYLKTAWDMGNARLEEAIMEVASSIISGIEPTKDDQPSRETIGKEVNSQQVATDIAFRVIADHIRTLSFAIADGIQPGNTDRNYVLRRILRRAVRYGRTLGFHEPFFYKLVDVLAHTMGDVFPEIRAKKKHVQEVIRTEEEAFNKTLDGGLEVFEKVVTRLNELAEVGAFAAKTLGVISSECKSQPTTGDDFSRFIEGTNAEITALVSETGKLAYIDYTRFFGVEPGSFAHQCKLLLRADDGVRQPLGDLVRGGGKAFAAAGFEKTVNSQLEIANAFAKSANIFPGRAAFVLYDTYGFPFDLTELMARERGLTVDTAGFEKLMGEQRARARAAQKKEVISLSQIETTLPTKFVGYETLKADARVVEVVSMKDKTAVILDTSACYAEMGGQVGDTGELSVSGQLWRIVNTQKSGNTWLHLLETENLKLETAPVAGSTVTLSVDANRRRAIERHHSVTHLLHWALHEVVSKEASQKGSFVGPDKLTFDFNSAPLTPAQVADIEKLVNERIVENAGVSWTEVPYADVKSRKDVMQFFGDKYGDTVRVVQIGGGAGELNGYSMELCGGTHTRATGEIGLFRIVGENAIAAGVRRIEAIAGLTAYDVMKLDRELIKNVASKVNSPVHELEKKIEALLEQQKKLEKEVKLAMLRNASNAASELLGSAQTVNGVPLITHNLGDADGDFLQAIADSLKGRFKGVVVLGGCGNNAVALIVTVSPEFTAKVQAGKLIQQIAPIVGGKGGGKSDNARGGGKDASKLDEALAKARTLIS